MYQKWLFACWAGFLVLPGKTQNRLSAADVLASARRDTTVEWQRKQIDYVRKLDPRLPFIEQIGLRTETDRFDWQRQEYLARMSVNGLKEIRRQYNYQQSDLAVMESRYRILLHEALVERYAVLLQYRHQQNNLDLKSRLLQVYADEIQVLRKRAMLDAGADVAEIIKAEYDRDEQALQLAAAADRYQQLRKEIQVLVQIPSGNWELDTAGFVHPDQIMPLVGELPVLLPAHPELAEEAAKIARIEADISLENAKSKQVLDFVQLRHNNRPDEPFGQNLSIGLGINLPFKGSSRYKTAILQIEKNAATLDLEMERSSRAREVEAVRGRLAALTARRLLILQQLENNQAQYTLQQAETGQVAVDPLVLLRAKELQLKRAGNLLETERELYEQYLLVLDVSGRLSASPMVNYLSAAKTGF